MGDPSRPLIAVTLGDPAGIGPEIALQAALHPTVAAQARVCLVGERHALQAAAAALSVETPLCPTTDPDGAVYASDTVTLIDTATLASPLAWGQISAAGGAAAFAAIERANALASGGRVAAVATAPIHKESLRLAKVPYIDHTTAFAELTASVQVMTLFATHRLRIFFLTRHIALRDVPGALTIDGVRTGIAQAIGHLRDLGVEHPHLAVAALNPHGGEHGLFGSEEQTVLEPAIKGAQALSDARVSGPIPADAVFHQAAHGRYDAVLSLFHDQGHIAAKTLDFHGTVSFTLGLPYLRTSVDHGTAFDIAGQGTADPRGMRAAILAACDHAASYRRRTGGDRSPTPTHA